MLEIFMALTHGMLLALGLIMPLGVQNVFIFNQGSTHTHLKHAFPSVIAASMCDTFLIIIAILGLSTQLMENPMLKLAMLCTGFIFLLYMGCSIWQQVSKQDSKPKVAHRWKKQVFFAVSVSLLNPHAIIDTIIVIGGSSLIYEDNLKIVFALACIVVSWLWFICLALLGHRLNKHDKEGVWLRKINKIAAVIIWCTALWIGVDVWKMVKQMI